MADKLNGSTPGVGHNSDLNSEQFLTFLSELDEAEAEHGSALAACKEPKKKIKEVRKRIKDAGFDLKAFDRAREDAMRPASEREREHQQHQMMMAWQRKPVGTQATIFDLPPQVFTVAELKMVDNQGFVSGKNGDRADANPHTPGNEAHQRWSVAWTRGQAEKVTEEIKGPEAAKKKPGRPRKDAAPENGAANGAAEEGEAGQHGEADKFVDGLTPPESGDDVGHAVLE